MVAYIYEYVKHLIVYFGWIMWSELYLNETLLQMETFNSRIGKKKTVEEITEFLGLDHQALSQNHPE